MFRNLWEYNFTQKDALLPGTRVALFEKEENIFTHVVTYKYLRMGTTEENGRVVFADLDQYGEYVVVTGGMRKTVTLNGKTLAEIPETFRNYSLAAQTQTSRGNPGHPEAAGPIKQIADHRRLCYTGNGLFPSGNHKQIRTKNDVLSNKTTYFPA